MSKAYVTCAWSEVPHLSEEMQKEMLDATPPHLRDARSKGIPSLGAGAIYPVPESEIVVPDFAIPAHWLRLYALDVGWNRTACLWGVKDVDSDTIYLVAEHYRGQAEPSIHADAIKARKVSHGVIDPAARGRSQVDGEQLIQTYKNLGLKLELANNAVEAGIYEMWQHLSTGRMKVFESLSNWRSEYRLYRRDEKGRIIKENDHLMDCARYLVNAQHRQWKHKDRLKEELVESFKMIDEEFGY